MMRRGLIGAAGLAGLGGAAAWMLRRRDAAAYDRAAAETWRGPDPGRPALDELLRVATLAPNSHNTQPWRFARDGAAWRILPDPTRRTPVVDPDDHHLWISLGCAVETMVQAAPALGLHVEAEPLAGDGALIRTAPAPRRATPMAAAIAQRHSRRGPYDGVALTPGEVAALADAGADAAAGLALITEPAARARLSELILDANRLQMRDAAFVAELLSWIRFSAGAALDARDGLFAGCMGAPVVPQALGRLAFPWVFTEAAETDRLAGLLATTPAFAVFAAAAATPEGWMAVGRAVQRLCLQATALGLSTAFVNQPVEVATLRTALAAQAGFGDRRPDLVLRLGRGGAMPAALRRPLAEVMLEG